MLKNVEGQMSNYLSGASNWGILLLYRTQPFYEIAIVGKNSTKKRAKLCLDYQPNKMLLGSQKESSLPLLENKLVNGKTLIYVCINKACKLPVENVPEALLQMK